MANLPSSLLKQVVDQFPLEESIKKDGVLPFLKKRGVKDEEIAASGFEGLIKENPSARLRREDLQKAEAARKENIIVGGVVGVVATPDQAKAAIDPAQISEAFANDFKVNEVSEFLIEQGNSEEDVKAAMDKSMIDKIQEASDAGIDVEEINNYLVDDLGMTPLEAEDLIKKQNLGVTPTGIPDEGDFPISEEVVKRVPEYTPEVLADMYRSMGQRYEADARSIAGIWSPEQKQRATEDSYTLASTIAQGMAKHNVDVSVEADGEGQFQLIWNSPDGPQQLDSSFWNTIGNSEYEIGGAIAMATIGVRLGGALPYPGAKLIAGIVAGAVGAAGGKAADLARLASATNELDNIKAAQYIDVMKDAGVADLTFGILGTTAIKASIGTVKLIGSAFDKATRGNLNGAYDALKTHMGVDDAQVDEIIKEWEIATGSKAPGLLRKTRATFVLPRTLPGGEDILAQAGQMNPRVGAQVIKSISDRSKNVLSSVDNITNDNLAVVLTDDLVNYTSEVKNFYGGIKNHAIDAMKDTPYEFDYDKLAIEPVFKSIGDKINNPAIKEAFLNRLARVRQLGQVTDLKDEPIEGIETGLRSFENLLELRKVVMEFKHNKRISQFGDFEAINGVVKNIDQEIASAVTKNMTQGDTWLKEWKRANTEYSKMLSLKDNVMYKALTAKGINVDKVVSLLVKDIKAIDGTFMQVMGKLPVRTRVLAEGAVMKKLVSNNTLGFEGGLQATDFMRLQKDLSSIGFTTPQARETKRAIGELAKVFKNDVNIFRATGQITTEKFTSYLTFDPVVRLKFVIANQSFNYFRKLLPGAKAEAAALITKVSKLIKDPANSKGMEELIRALPKDPELANSIKQLAIEYTKFGYKEAYPKVKVYRTGIPGRTHKAIKGKLGEGIYWTTSKDVARERSKATGGKLISEKILPARIADEGNVKDITGIDIKDIRDNSEAIDKLKDKGFTGLTIGEDMVIFK